MGLLKPREGIRTAPHVKLHRAVSPLAQWSTATTPSNVGDPQNPNGSIPIRHLLCRAAKLPCRLCRYHEGSQGYCRERLPLDRNRCLGGFSTGRGTEQTDPLRPIQLSKPVDDLGQYWIVGGWWSEGPRERFRHVRYSQSATTPRL